jgi:hypothetical protein
MLSIWGFLHYYLLDKPIVACRALETAPEDFKERAQKAECGNYWREAIRGYPSSDECDG